MPKAPIDTADSLQLADWLEISAICAEGHSASGYHLISLLKLATTSDEEREQLLQDTFAELNIRAIATQCGYPFAIKGQILKLRCEDWREYPAYIFCLLVSWLGVNSVRRPNPTRLFERLATAAARGLMGGQGAKFGFPRRNGLPRGFANALEALCKELKEGVGLNREAHVYDEKDDALDVVAWRDFPDGLPGQLLLFGQCAAGANWMEKRSDLNPKAFCHKWLQRFPVSPLTKAFFIPHRVERGRWDHLGYDAGIVLDRCRIAYLAPSTEDYGDHIRWLEAAVERVHRES